MVRLFLAAFAKSGIAVSLINCFHFFAEAICLKARSVDETSHLAKAFRSSPYVSSMCGSDFPWRTEASFQPRFTASPIPAFMPCPPTGLWMWAASPAKRMRFFLYCPAIRRWIVYVENQFFFCMVTLCVCSMCAFKEA